MWVKSGGKGKVEMVGYSETVVVGILHARE